MMTDILNQIDGLVWGPWLLVLLVGTGVLLTCRLSLLQVLKLPRALKLIFFARNKGDGDIDSFKALCTALAATVGTGNIVGVATAIKLGGPGALFWMWLAAFFGMATKYAEGCLAVKYRGVDDQGNIAGGPMYYIEMGLGKKWKPLAVAFAIFGIMTAMLGSGTTTQMNAITASVQAGFGVSTYITCAVITVLVAIITFGGLKSISKTASKIVPAMAVVYFIVTVIFLGLNAGELPHAIALVIDGAFNGTAAAGGFAGAGVMLVLRSGIARDRSGGSKDQVAGRAGTDLHDRHLHRYHHHLHHDRPHHHRVRPVAGRAQWRRAHAGSFCDDLRRFRSLPSDDLLNALCFHHHHRLELLWGTLLGIPLRHEDHPCVPRVLHRRAGFRSLPEAGSHLGAG